MSGAGASAGGDGLLIRAATEADVPAIQRIYEPHVLRGFATFEEVPPPVEEMAARMAAIKAQAYPYLVAERDGRILGYSYASAYRARPAYRNTVEDSIYLEEGLAGQGIGRRLLAALIDACEAGPWRQMIAVIGDSGNAPSISMHARLGFRMVGTLESVGFKLGRWVDTVLMQRPLGPGDGSAPAPRP